MKYPLVIGYLSLKGISPEQIAEELGISTRTFRNKLNGVSDFTLPETRYIASRAEQPISVIFSSRGIA